MRPCWNIRDAITVLETKKRGPFRPADLALATDAWRVLSIGLGRFAQAEVHYKKALKALSERPEGLERRRLQLLSPGPMV